MNKFSVFIDESGNSGLNLFDNQQPYFWVGGLLIPEEKESLLEDKIKPLLLQLDKKELHGNELGVGRINIISKALISIYKEINAKFFFVRVNKAHISSMKFVDTLIDSGNNPAIPSLYYASRATRLMFAQPISTLFSREAQELFWDIYQNKKYDEYKNFLTDFKIAFELQVPDPRLREIIGSALDYGIKYPEKLLDEGQGEYESPNLVSFTLLLDSLRNVLPLESSKITTVIHDEQNQFAKYLKEMYDLMKNISMKDSLVGYPKVGKIDKFTNDMKFASSDTSSGLQLIDIPLWIMKQVMDRGKVVTGDVELLRQHIYENGFISQFSYEALTDEVISINNEIMSVPLTEEQLKFGHEQVAIMEAIRIKNLKQLK